MPSYLQLNCQRTFIRLESLTDSKLFGRIRAKIEGDRHCDTKIPQLRSPSTSHPQLTDVNWPILDGISSPRSDSRFYSHFDYGQQVQHSNSKERQKLGNEACRIHPLSVPSWTLVCDRTGSIRRDSKRSRGIGAFFEILSKTAFPRVQKGKSLELFANCFGLKISVG